MDDRYAINAAKTEIREGYNTGCLDRILPHFAPGYTDFSDGFPSCAREEAHAVLHARLTMMFAGYDVVFVPISADINLLGDRALVHGWHHTTLTPKSDGGPPMETHTRFLELWQRRDDGWKLALFIDNQDPPPALLSETLTAILSGALNPLAGVEAPALEQGP